MTEAISPNSGIIHTTIDQDNRPMTKDELMSKVQFPEFKDLIEQYDQIKEGLVNKVKELAESRENHQPQTSAVFQETLKKYNLSEKEGLDLLKKAEEKIQQQKHLKA